MRAARITGERAVEVADVSEPDPVEDWAKVRVEAAPLCTEYKAWERGAERFVGHEAAGEVVAVAGPGDVAPGDRVAVMPTFPCGTCRLCRAGAYIHCEEKHDFEAVTGSPHGKRTAAEYVLKPDWLLVPIPDGMSSLHASLACCGLGPTFGACRRLGVDGTDTVLVSGAGPVGLGGVINATHHGARVLVSEPNAFRADLARDLGADAVVDPTDDGGAELDALTDGAGVDAALECTGIPDAQRFALEAVRRRGSLAFVGEGGELSVHISDDLIRTGVEVVGQWHYDRGLAPDLLDVIAANAGKLEAFVTHEFPLEAIGEAFERQAAGETGKVVLRP